MTSICVQNLVSRWLISAVSILAIGFLSLAKAENINIMISPPRGGFGDTAVNLLMIERLSHFYKDTDTVVNVVYNRESEEQIQVLWPDFDPKKEKQIIRGIVFSKDTKAQELDYVITFSARHWAPKTLGKKTIGYYEYEELQTDVHGFFESVKNYQVKTPINMILNGSYMINTGITSGLYVLDGFRPEDFNKKTTFELLSKTNPSVVFSSEAKLGYAYTSSQPLAQQYVSAVEKWINQRNIEVVIVTNHDVTVTNPLVKIIKMKNLPFTLNQKIIKSSDIPILVTGDGSLSLAIEGRKPFFYALYAWKRFTPEVLRNTLKEKSKFFRTNRWALDLVSNLTSLDITGQRSYESEFLSVMENPQLQSELARIFDHLTKNNSLVSFVEKDIQFSKLIRGRENVFSAAVDSYVYVLWMRYRQSKDFNHFVSKIESELFNRQFDARQRIRQFLGMISIKDYPIEKFAKYFSDALTSDDFELRHAAKEVIIDLHASINLPELFLLLDDSGKKEVQRILRNIAGQDPYQWGGYANSASLTLSRISKTMCYQFYKK